MRVIRVGKRKRIYIFLLFAVAVSATGIMQLSIAKADPIITAQSWTGLPLPSSTIITHKDNGLTTFRDNGCNTTNDSDSTLNIVSRYSGDSSDYTVVNNSSGWKVFVCPHLRAVGADGTVYFVQSNTTNNSKRIVAKYKDNIKWITSIPNGACNYYPQLFDMNVGYDGNLYVNIRHESCGSPTQLKLTSFSAHDGAIRFATTLPNSQSALNVGLASREIMPYDNGIAVVNNGVNVYYYTYSGVNESSKTFSPSVPSGSTTTLSGINESGRAYLAVNTPTARKIFYKDTNNATIQELFPSVGGDYVTDLYPAPNNKLAFRWYKNYERGVGYFDTNNSELFSTSLHYDGNYSMASNPQPWVIVGSDGKLITIRTMAYGTQRNVYVDSLSTTGAKTRLLDSDAEFGTSTTDKFATSNFSPHSVGNGVINMLLCHTTGSSSNSLCPSYENPQIVTIPTSASYDYPRSALFSALNADNDGDGLTVSEEASQGTLDTTTDFDQDGLTDHLESVKLPNRDALFCNSSTFYCEYPNPIQKDIYIEADWMVKSGANGYSAKPTTVQLNAVKSAFNNKGILVHFDTGELGGGNEVPYNDDILFASTSGIADFYDYKVGGDGVTRQFNNDRYDTYHYMLFGNTFDSATTYTGASYPGDDDTFISYGIIEANFNGPAFDTAVSAVIMHELGHALCLTNSSSYANQSASCIFSGIDTNAGPGYPSVENYDYSHTLVDFSTGQAGSSDHDDWSALQLRDFTLLDKGDPNPTPNSFNAKHTKKVKSKPIVGKPVKVIKDKPR